MSVADKLDELAAEGKLHGFTVWKTKDGYQANLQTGKSNSWSVMRGPTPSAAIEAVLGIRESVEAYDDANDIVATPLADFGEAAIANLVADAEAEVAEPEAGIFD